MIRVLDSAGSTLVEWGRQQQQQHERVLKMAMDFEEGHQGAMRCVKYFGKAGGGYMYEGR